MFIQCDTSQDGYLSLEELRDGMSNILGTLKAQASDWEELVEQLDINGDGKIDYQEFITAAVNRAKLINDQNLEMAFKMFDQDGNGQISIAELKNVFQGCHKMDKEDEQLWQLIMDEVDKNHDNIISHEEFNSAMHAVMDQRTVTSFGSQVSFNLTT